MSWKCLKKAKLAQSVEPAPAAPAVHQMVVRWEPCDKAETVETTYAVRTRNRFEALATRDSPAKSTQPLNFLDSASPQLNSVGSAEFTDLEVVLDSGACEHVVDSSMTPGYQVLESEGSRAGSCFLAANGERMPNRGEVHLQLHSAGNEILSKFQVAGISKPLWSVGRICDAGYEVRFSKSGAQIIHPASGKTVGNFERKNGLYMSTMKLRNPKSPTFARQGR